MTAEDGVTITWVALPPSMCALVMGAPQSACSRCVPALTGTGLKCALCPHNQGKGTGSCPLKTTLHGDLCTNKACPAYYPPVDC
jgi:hypothetical protein